MKENGILSKVRIYSSERRGRRENSITKLRIKEKDQATKSGESREGMLLKVLLVRPFELD